MSEHLLHILLYVYVLLIEEIYEFDNNEDVLEMASGRASVRKFYLVEDLECDKSYIIIV